MNIKSVRFHLTLWYSLSLVLAIGTVFIFFYWVTQRELYSHTDGILLSHLNKIKEFANCEDIVCGGFLADEFAEVPGMLVVLIDASGNVIKSSQNVESMKNAITQTAGLLKTTENRLMIDRSLGQTMMRIAMERVDEKKIVIVGHPIDVIQTSLKGLITDLLLVFIILVLPTIAGGVVLAKRAMKPISNINDKLGRISSSNLSERIPNPGTKDEFEDLANTSNDLLDRIEEAFGRERQFIGDVAHELKTPLSAFKGSVEIALARTRSVEEYKQVLEGLSGDAQRLEKTLGNVLDLAWSESETSGQTGTKFNLSELVKELAEIADKLAYSKKIKIISRVQEKVFIEGKKDRIFRSLLNILSNAIKYTGEDGEINIWLYNQKKQAIVNIKDTGIGISKKDLPHIFERFYRSGRVSADSGSGLGLAIARSIVTSCKGEIRVSSRIGKGTTFNILLPLA